MINIADYAGDKSKVSDHFYSDKAPLPTLLTIPVYEFLKLIGFDKVDKQTGMRFPVHVFRVHGLPDERYIMNNELMPIFLIGDFLYASLPFVLIIILSFLALHRLKTNVSPVLLVMLAFYGFLSSCFPELFSIMFSQDFSS